MNAHDDAHEDPRELFARMRRNLIDTQTDRLTEADCAELEAQP